MMRKIIVAPLNWGLGHATRCIPIIKALQNNNCIPIIASDGAALLLLQKEFPHLTTYELPTYGIQYTKNKSLKWGLFLNLPRIVKTVKKERKIIAKIVAKEKATGIISDNRFGAYTTKVPSVYITHQIRVFSGSTTMITSKLHQKIIKKFTACWVPDFKGQKNLSGKLSHDIKVDFPVKFIEPLSRLNHQEEDKKYDILVLLSGPEPQRTLLEDKLIKELKNRKEKILFVRGLVEKMQNQSANKNILFCNFMLCDELQKAISQSKVVISRPGYSTIMDLYKLRAKAFFIPTPGQFEQEYLAEYLAYKKIAPFCKQDDFNYVLLNALRQYSGFVNYGKEAKQNFDFSIFK